MNVWVTGGAGFVGSALIRALKDKGGINIVSLDDYSSGSRDNHVYGVEYIEDSTINIEKYIRANHDSPDVMFHFGEYSRVENSFLDSKRIYESNILGTASVFNCCVKNDIRLIYSGSSTQFTKDTTNYIKSPYQWSKELNSRQLNFLHERGMVDSVTAYFYNVYGPGEISVGEYATVIGIFREAMIKSEPLSIVRPGTQVRNFTFIDDLVRGLVHLLNEGSGDNYCFACPDSYSIDQLADMFGGPKILIPPRQGNRISAGFDLTKVNALGWSATTKLPNIIDQLRENDWYYK